jgi:hypothetical protein
VRDWPSGPRNSAGEEVQQREYDHETDQEGDEHRRIGPYRSYAERWSDACPKRAGEGEHGEDWSEFAEWESGGRAHRSPRLPRIPA